MKSLKDLKHNPRNPRKITDHKLKDMKKSYQKYGPLHGFVFNTRLDQLVGGHQTSKLLPKDAEITILKTYETPTAKRTVASGYVEVDGERFPYREVDADEKWHRGATIAANKHGGQWEEDILKEDLTWLEEEGEDLETVGYDEDERLALFNATKENKHDVIEPDIAPQYGVLIELTDEEEQEDIFQEMQGRGLKCKLIT